MIFTDAGNIEHEGESNSLASFLKNHPGKEGEVAAAVAAWQAAKIAATQETITAAQAAQQQAEQERDAAVAARDIAQTNILQARAAATVVFTELTEAIDSAQAKGQAAIAQLVTQAQAEEIEKARQRAELEAQIAERQAKLDALGE